MSKDDLMPWHQTWMKDIEYDRVDLVQEGANSQAFIKFIKSKGGSTMDLEQIIAKMKPEHAEIIRKAFEDQEAAHAVALEAAVAKAKEEATPVVVGDSEEEIVKSIKDPAVKALMEVQIAKTRAAEDAAKQLRSAQDDLEAVAKAKEVPNLGTDEENLASIYKKLKTADPALCEEVFGIFKAASALTKEAGAFTEIGKSVTDAGVGSDEQTAWGKIEAAAESIAKAGGITKAAAISKAIKENPALYEAYTRSQG